MGKLIILFNRNVMGIFDEYFNRAIHRVTSSVWENEYVFVYVVLSKGMPFETVNVVRDKLGLSRGSVTFPTFGGDIFVVGRSHGAGWASEYKWGQIRRWGQMGPPLLSPWIFRQPGRVCIHWKGLWK